MMTATDAASEERISEREAEIDELVLRYQAGDAQAAEELLGSIMQPLITRFARLIATGRGYRADRPIDVRWVSLWLPGDIRKALIKAPIQPGNISIAGRSAQRIASLVSSVWDADDCLQEVQLAFLEMAKRYKKVGSSFFRYAYTALPYTLRARLRRATNDALLYRLPISERQEERGGGQENGLADPETLEDQLARMGLENDGPDNEWVEGFTSHEVFDGLTQEQRHALLATYGQGKRAIEVAEELGLAESTIFKRRQRGVQKARENAADLNLIEEDSL